MVPLVTLTVILIAMWMWSKGSDAFTAQVRTCLTGTALCPIVCGLVVALGLVVGRRVEELPAFTVLVACIGVLMAAALMAVASELCHHRVPDEHQGRLDASARPARVQVPSAWRRAAVLRHTLERTADIPAFAIGKTDVTNAQYKAFLDDTGYTPAVYDNFLDHWEKDTRLGAEGVNLLNCSGAAAWQTVFHFHLHVIPRYSDKSKDRMRLPSSREMPSDPDERIRYAGLLAAGCLLDLVENDPQRR
jgi:hypothetical protein